MAGRPELGPTRWRAMAREAELAVDDGFRDSERQTTKQDYQENEELITNSPKHLVRPEREPGVFATATG